MSLPQGVSLRQSERSPSSSKPTPGESAARATDEKEEDDMHPIVSFMPPASTEHGTLHDLMSARVWGNHMIWRAGVSAVAVL